MRKKTIFISLAALVLVVGAVGHSYLRMQSQIRDAEPSGIASAEADIVAVTFSSQWCGPCKILKPRLAAIKPDFASKPVRFVELSFTFGEQDNFQDLAQAEGFSSVYERYNKATGFTVLVNRDTGNVIDILTIDHTKADMRSIIENALAAKV